MILKGLVKNDLCRFIAAYFLDDVFASPGEFSEYQVMAIFGYSLQIYGDFLDIRIWQ